MEGKDGPLATVGLGLATLYHEFEAHKHAKGTGPFEPKSMRSPDPGDREISPIRGDFVAIEATAKESGAVLAKDLKRMGDKKRWVVQTCGFSTCTDRQYSRGRVSSLSPQRGTCRGNGSWEKTRLLFER
jgi:hypothetical protein